MTELNVPLLRKVMEHIETNPLEWDQSMWVTSVHRIEYGCGDVDVIPLELAKPQATPPTFCGTAFCFAGHVANMTGWNPIWHGSSFDSTRMIKDGEKRHVEYLAMDELGLTKHQANVLFNACNDLHRLRRLVDALIAGDAI